MTWCASTPDGDLCGPAAGGYDYTASDGALTDTAHVTVNIDCVNDAPVAGDDTVTATEDTDLDTPTADLLLNDSDIDTASLTVTAVLGAVGGAAVLMDNGTPGDTTDDFVRFTPNANLCGIAAGGYDYTVSDGALTDTGHVTVNIDCVNDAPELDLDGPLVAGIDNSASFTEDAGPTTLAPDATVGDVDDTDLESALVTLTNRPDGIDESLSADTLICAPISVAAYDSLTGELALTGTASVTDYQDCLRTVAYNNADQDPDAANRIIEWTVNDGDDDSAVAITTVTVTPVNDDPVVTLTGPSTADEGDTVSYSFTVTDVDSDTFTVVTSDCGANGVQTNYAFLVDSGSFDCTWADNFDDEDVSVDVSDDDGGTDTDSISVDIANVDPIVTLSGPATSDEGQTQSYTFSIADDGADTFTVVTSDCGANGVQTNYAFLVDSGSFDCTWADNFDDEDVSVDVSDDDGGTDTDSISVDIANVDPIVTLSGPATSDEGQTQSYTFSIADDGADTFTVVTSDCGANGVQTNYAFLVDSGSFDCTWADNFDDEDVSVDVSDDDGGTDTDSISVDIANVDPIVTLSGPATSDEGQTQSYTFSIADDGADTFTVVTSDCGANGVQTNYAFLVDSGSFDCTWADNFDDEDVSVDVSDDDGGTDTDSISVDIANVDPIVTLSGPATSDEGQTQSYTFSIADDGADTFTVVTSDCGANGVQTNYAFLVDSGSFDCTWADNFDDEDVSVDVSDDDGGTDTDSISVDIANVDPIVTLSGPATSDEGQTQSYTFSIADDGADTFTVVTSDCGANGVQTNYAFLVDSGSFDCTWADNFDDEDVSVDVSDDDGGTDTDSISVDIANVDPIVTLSGPATSDEGQTQSYTFSIADDGADTFTVVTSDCGANGVQTNYAFLVDSGSFDCTWADNFDDEDVSVDVSDDDGGTDTDSISVDIANVDPIVTLSGPATSDEGQTQSYTFSIADDGADTFTVDTSDCGANGVQTNYAFLVDRGSFDCTWADNFDDEDVSVDVSDDDRGTDTDSISVDIANVDPIVTLSGPATSDEGQTQSYTFSIADDGADTFTVVTSDCGANGVQTNYAFLVDSGSFDCTWADNFDDEDVSVDVSDDDGGTDTDSISVDIANVDPIVTLSGPATSDEGQTQSYTFSIADDGADTFTVVTSDCGANGVQTNYAFLVDSGSFDCTWADNFDDEDVSVDVSDDDGGTDTDSISVDIANVDPIVTLSGPASVSESAITQHTYSFDTTDDGTADTFSAGTPNCGSGTYVAASLAFDSGTGDGSFQCKFLDDAGTGPSNGTTVSITITDDDSGAGTGSQAVTVNNVPPTVSLIGPSPVSESQTLRNYVFDTTDPGADTFTAGTPSCGVSGVFVGPIMFNPATGDGNFDCRFADDNPTEYPLRCHHGEHHDHRR